MSALIYKCESGYDVEYTYGDKSEYAPCSWQGPRERMDAIDPAWWGDGIAAGEPMPAGQCPVCGGVIEVHDDDIPDDVLELMVMIAMKRWGLADENNS